MVVLVNILLALAWAAVTGSLALANLVFGFFVAACALAMLRHEAGPVRYLERAWHLAALGGLFVRELVISGLRVAVIALRPSLPLRPGIIACPLRVRRDFEIALLANLITLTPGTLSLFVSKDHKTLYVHAIDVPDEAQLIADIREGFERKIMEAFR